MRKLTLCVPQGCPISDHIHIPSFSFKKPKYRETFSADGARLQLILFYIFGILMLTFAADNLMVCVCIDASISDHVNLFITDVPAQG